MPFFYGLYGNIYYLIGTIFVMIAAFLAMYAQMKVQKTYSRYKKIPNSRGMTGYQIAREMLDSEGLRDIQIYESKGVLSDHFHPGKRTIHLSSDVYHGTSIAALAIAAHECGHAIQHKEKYAPITLRNAILPIANIGQYLGWFAIFIGLAIRNTNIAWFGLFAMCGILLFQVVTLPVEFDASSRALSVLRTGYLNESEYAGAKSMLSAAALTYVAAMISTLMSMLRIFLVILGNSRND